MFKVPFFIGCLCSCMWMACQPNVPAKSVETSILSASNDSLYKLVVAKHDEVMPRNATIEQWQAKLRPMLQDESKKVWKDSILTCLSHLQQGYDGMMDWMRNFKSTDLHEEDYQKMSEQEVQAYLKNEEKIIEAVAKQMLESIAEAEQLASKLK